MTAYTTISNGLVAVGAKPFATTIQALRDNPLAIAEGDATAPKIQMAAIPGIVGNVRVDHTGTTANVVQLTYAGTWLTGDMWVDFGGGVVFRIRTSTDGGSTWSGYNTLVTATVSSTYCGRFILNRLTGAWDIRGALVSAFSRNTGTTSGTINAIEFSFSSAAFTHNGRHFLSYAGQA